MKRLTVFFSPDRLAVEIQNGITRNVSGTPIEALNAMNPDDLGVLVAFCRAVCKHVDSPSSPSMFMEAKS